jgi:protein-disulfide isomerase
MIEFSDYLCGHCREFALDKEPLIEEAYIATGKVQYVFHYYALGEAQVLLGEASHCAADQGQFWAYHRTMFENQSRFGSVDSLETLQRLLDEFAEQAGLDMAGFQACWTGHENQEAIIRAVQDARERGVSGTPTFAIGGELLVGNQPYEVFEQAIEAALTEAAQ